MLSALCSANALPLKIRKRRSSRTRCLTARAQAAPTASHEPAQAAPTSVAHSFYCVGNVGVFLIQPGPPLMSSIRAYIWCARAGATFGRMTPPTPVWRAQSADNFPLLNCDLALRALWRRRAAQFIVCTDEPNWSRPFHILSSRLRRAI